MTTAANKSSMSMETARRRLDDRLRSAGIPVSDVSGTASEDERCRAAAEAIEALRRRRNRASPDGPAAGPPVAPVRDPAPDGEPAPEPVPESAPEPAPAPPPATASSRSSVDSPGHTPSAAPSRVRPRAPRVGTRDRLVSAVRASRWPAALLLVGIVAGAGGVALAPSRAPGPEVAAAANAGPADGSFAEPPEDVSGSAPDDAYEDAPEAFGADADRNALLSDNLRLQRALVTLETELATLRGAPAQPVGSDEAAMRDVAPLGEADFGAADLGAADVEEAELRDVSQAVEDADAELGLIELGGADPSADPSDLARARLGVRRRLLDAIGTEAFVATRAARGEPNRLAVDAVPNDPAYAALDAGDALLAIDGEPVFDADDVLAADTAIPRELVVLRRGERASIEVTAPLTPLEVSTQSLPAWAWVPPEIE